MTSTTADQDAEPPRRATPTRRTFNALLGYGLDSATAEALVTAGHTVSRLQQLDSGALLNLGIPVDVVHRIHELARPPVPAETVYRLLFESRGVCCVCRSPNAPVILHHVIEWSDSRSHDEPNLVVLCLNHHGDAHTRHELSQNLDADRLRAAKAAWCEAVRRLDQQLVFRPPWMGEGIWDYFNHTRVIRALLAAGVALATIPHYWEARRLGLLGEDGTFTDAGLVNGRRYIYDGTHVGTNALYMFFTAATERLFQVQQPVPTSLDFSRTLFRDVATDGCLAAVKGRFWFRTEAGAPASGPGQRRTGVHRRNGVEVRFTIDAWEALSDSAYGHHIAGHWIATAVGVIRSRTRDAKRDLLVVEMTCLAIGSCWGDPIVSKCPYQFEEVVEPPDDWWESDAEPDGET